MAVSLCFIHASMLTWLAFVMYCIETLMQGLADCCTSCADKVDLATKKFKVGSCLPCPAHLCNCL